VDFLNGSAYSVKPPVDAIEGAKIETNNYSVRRARRAAGVCRMPPSSPGTNHFHGALWEFLRNDMFDAANYSKTAKRQSSVKNQFGGTLGGPIRRDKMFFFMDYEGTPFRQAYPI